MALTPLLSPLAGSLMPQMMELEKVYTSQFVGLLVFFLPPPPHAMLLMGTHLPNGPLSSDLLGFGWDNAFSDVIPFKKVSQEINERGTLIFCHAKHRGTCFKTPRQDEKHDWKLDQPCFKLDSLLHLIL